MYSVFLGLASWSLSRWVNREADSAESCGPGYSLRPTENTVIVIDPYFCTLGWYTEELKYTSGTFLSQIYLSDIKYFSCCFSQVSSFGH